LPQLYINILIKNNLQLETRKLIFILFVFFYRLIVWRFKVDELAV